MPPGQKLTPANHHWWPEGLSKQWVDADGRVTQLSWDGSEVYSTPANFGAIRNAHHIKRGRDSPWSGTFEPVFDKADNAFPDFAAWLLTLDAKPSRPKARFEDRFRAKPLTQERRIQMAECLASLIVRGPRSRHSIKITIKSYLGVDGIDDHSINKTLIAANMHANQEAVSRTIAGGGKFVALISEDAEFIYGDGFLHNFPTGIDRPIAARCVIPILPSVSILFSQPLSYRTQPELIAMALRPNEVRFLNDTIQIYSCERIFFRNQKPKLISDFTRREHMEFTHHAHPWLDQLIDAAAKFLPSK